MKTSLVVSVLFVLLVVPSAFADDAVGSAFGTLTTAQSLGQGKADLGFGVGFADYTSFVGTLAYGLSEFTDGRLKLGLVDPDGGDTEFTFGADLKWHALEYGPHTNHPFDIAFGGFFEYVDFGAASVFQIGGQIVGSYPYTMNNGQNLNPYARFNVRLESLSWDRPAGSNADDSESNLKVGLNGGVQWVVSTTVSFYAEFQLDGNDGLFLGVDYSVM